MTTQGISPKLPEKIYRKVTEIGYRFGDDLGNGSFGNAFRCHLVDTNGVEGKEMAVKHVNLDVKYTPTYTDQKSGEQLRVIEEQKWTEKDRLRTTKWRKDGPMSSIDREFMVEVMPEHACIKSGEGVRNELLVMNRANHRNVVKLVNVLSFDHTPIGSRMPHERHILIFMEMAKTDLYEHRIKFEKALDREEARNYSEQIASGLSHLHSNGIYHLDLKPHNILVYSTSNLITLKISDFGLALLFPFEHSKRTYGYRWDTLAYSDPVITRIIELCKLKPSFIGYKHSFDAYKADVWSYGIIVLQFFITSQRYLKLFNDYYATLIRDANFNIGCVYVSELNRINTYPQLTHFLRNIFVMNASQRFSAKQCLQHYWIRNEKTVI